MQLQHLISAEHTLMSALAAVVGLAGGIAAKGFRYMFNWVQTFANGSDADLIESLRAMSWGATVWLPAVGGRLVAPLICFRAREA